MDEDIKYPSWLEPDDLDPELAESITETESMTVLRHPLVYSVPYTPIMNKLLNEQLYAKRERLKSALKDHDWRLFVMLFERPHRLNAFAQIAHQMKPRTRWTILGEVYVDSENIWQNLNLWRFELTAPYPDREWIMSTNERHALKKLPEQLTLYRGIVYDNQKWSLSWTLSESRAKWFANRFAKPSDDPRVLIGSANRADIIAYLSGRGEEEIVILPEQVDISYDYSVRDD